MTDRPTFVLMNAPVLTPDGVERLTVVIDLDLIDDLARSSEALRAKLARQDREMEDGDEP
jgi:hypothetical protein